MKKLKKDEIYKNLSAFLQTKGVELKDGSITARIKNGCSILSDTINFAQGNLQKAKAQMDKKLNEMREVIHQKTAPKTQPPPKAAPAKPPSKAKAKAKAKPKPQPKPVEKKTKPTTSAKARPGKATA